MKRFFRSVILDDYRQAYAKLQKFRREAESRRVLDENNLSKIRVLVASGKPLRVEFGAGIPRGLEGWAYVDRVHTCDLVMGLTQPLMFPDDSVDEIYSSHLLVHFNYTELLGFLRECRRILVPGGRFSAACSKCQVAIKPYNRPGFPMFYSCVDTDLHSTGQHESMPLTT